MECALVTRLPSGSQWVYEIKLDGFRAIAVKSGPVKLFSRRRKLFSQYPHIVEAIEAIPNGTVLDGEIVALDDEGRPNFNLLQHSRTETSRVCYFVFDLLVYQNRDLTGLPLTKRCALLKKVLQPSQRVRILDQFEVSAADIVAAVRQQGF